ncbi:MAG TPA: RHS repeat-associated core domain-containing protein [Rhizomicrobium sp.]|nr:RHS repeat-associated core domain-containing protein [Rhizomicrobium sp.]
MAIARGRRSNTVKLLRSILLGGFSLLASSIANDAGATSDLPSIKIGTASLISPTAAKTYYGTSVASSDGLKGYTGTDTPAPPEIIELADALKHDPQLIYRYVANNIQIVWMYGLQKGALGAEIDKSGTAFDQAELMVALLRQSNIAASYVAGTIVLNGAQFQAWTGITNSRSACQLLSGGSIPAVINGTTATNCASGFPLGGAVTSVQMAHIWVKIQSAVNCPSTCVFDPAYKAHTWKNGIDLASAMGFASGDPYNAATDGHSYGSAPAPWASNFKTTASGGLNGLLQSYSDNLLAAIQSQNLQGAHLDDIIGGSVIVPVTADVWQSTLPYADPSPPYTPLVWTPPADPARYNAIPDKYRTTFKLQTYVYTWPDSDGEDTNIFSPQFFVDEIYGRRLSLTTDFTLKGINGAGDSEHQLAALLYNTIQLALDGGPLLDSHGDPLFTFVNRPTDSMNETTRDQPAHIHFYVDHPYAASADGTATAAGDYMDDDEDKRIVLTSSLSIVHGWGDVSPDLLAKWSSERSGNSFLPKLVGCSEESCTLTRTGLVGDGNREKTNAAWLAQFTRAAQIHAALAHSTLQVHHSFGVVYADNDLTTYCRYNWLSDCNLNIANSFDRIDVDSALSLANRTGNATAAADRRGALHAIAASAAALEGSVSAQLFDVVDPSSTASRFEWANLPPMDAKQNPRSLGPQRFYEFGGATEGAVDGVIQTEGYLVSPTEGGTNCPANDGQAAWTDQPELSGTECGEWGDALITTIKSYIDEGFDVVAPQEAFLGPGQRGGTMEPLRTGTGVPYAYTHQQSKQRGGALVATKYDASGLDPVQIAHIQIGERRAAYPLSGYLITKGGGGGTQTDMASTYNPAEAADVVKSQFVDRSNALGVSLKDGSLGYTSPASLRVGNGSFPFELSAGLSWHPGAHPGIPQKPTEPGSDWVMSWLNALGVSGSGLEAMGESDIRAAVGTIAAFVAAQDIYKTGALPTERAVAGVLANAWWVDAIQGNSVSVNVGGDTKQFVRPPTTSATPAFLLPGTGYGTVTQTGTRTPFEYQCVPSSEGPYAYSRGWDSSGVSFAVTNAGGDVEHFASWTNPYDMRAIAEDGCGRLTGYRLTSWTFPYSMSVSLEYGDAYDPFDYAEPHIERLMSVSNAIGRKISFRYAGPPQAVSSFDNSLTGGDLRQVLVDPNFASTTDPAGVVTNFTYAARATPSRPLVWQLLGTVATASNPAQTDVEYDYDGQGRVSAVKDATALSPGSTRPAYAFHIADGTRGERDDPLGQTYTVTYDTYGHPSSYVDEVGAKTAAVFDSRGRVVSYTYPEGDCEVFGYDDHNNTTDRWKVDRVSGCSTGAGASHVLHSSATYNQGWNKPNSVTDARGNQTTLTYHTSAPGKSLLDTVRRPMVVPEGTAVYSFDYDANGKLTDTTGPTGIVTHNVYDTAENLTSATLDPAGQNITTSFGYDPQGDVVSTTDPRNNVTTAQYDNDRRKTETHHNKAGAGSDLIAAEKTIYDNLGRATDEEVGSVLSGTTVSTWLTTKHTTYTPTSKVATVTDADNRTTTTQYDNADRVLTVTDPLTSPALRKVHFVYCGAADVDCAANAVKTEYRGWVSGTACSQAPPSLQECYRRVTYWPDGEVKRLKDANGNNTNYAYDDFVRLKTTTFPDSTFEQLGLDENGNVTSRTNRAGQTLSYTYNELNWLKQKVMPTASSSVTTSWTYLLDGRVDTLSDTTSSLIDYNYDTAGRMNQVTTHLPGFAANRTVTYTLDKNGNRTKLAWPPGDGAYYVGYCYDSLNRMTKATESTTDCATTPLATYAYDAQSRRTSVTYGNGASMSYPSYSNAGDLLTLTHDLSGTTNDNSFTYTYTQAHQTDSASASNSAWQWQPSGINSTAYVPDNLNQYKTIGSQTTGGTDCQGHAQGLSYDCNGNLTFDGITTYTYDAENRLLTATKTGLAATYAYDPLGRRTKKSGTGVAATDYLSDGTDEIAEYDDASKAMIRRIVPGPAIDEPIALVDPVHGNAKTYFHTDKQGSVIAMSDDTGALSEGPHIYDPFGNCFDGATPCSAADEPYLFTGRRWDAEIGCYYYRAREYCPGIGRFLQIDPVGYDADLNFYTYTNNDPTDFVDPMGQSVVSDIIKWAAKHEIRRALEAALKSAREAAKRQAWAQEKKLVEETGRGTREWSPAEVHELLETGEVKGYKAHHINNVADHPELAGEPDNIEFLPGNEAHLEVHGGNYRNSTNGPLKDRTAGGLLPKPPLSPSVVQLNGFLKEFDRAMAIVDEATNSVSLNPLDAGAAQ